MSRLNRFRWISSGLAVIFTILGVIGTICCLYVLEAICIVVLFVVFFLIVIKDRCPVCGRGLPFHPPLLREEEYCQACGNKIE